MRKEPEESREDLISAAIDALTQEDAVDTYKL